MSEAFFEVLGREFAVEAALVNSPFRNQAKLWHVGDPDPLRRGQSCESSGMSLRVGGNTNSSLEQQVEQATRFLQEYSPEIHRLRSLAGVECLRLRFGIFWQANIVAKFNHLPPGLLLAAGELGIEITLCEYLCN